MTEYTICFIVALIGIIAILFTNTYNKLQYNKLKIDKAELNIKNALNRKYQLLIKCIEFMNNNITIDEEVFNDFLNVNLKTISNIKLNNILEESEDLIKKCLDDNKKLYKNETIIDINKEIHDLNIVINGCKRFYNNNLTQYNKLICCFPTNLIAKMFKFKKRNFYEEGKIESFKILQD